jgi:multidrug efflux system outer membrane protein
MLDTKVASRSVSRTAGPRTFGALQGAVAAGLAVTMSLAGCAVGPRYRRPAAPVPAQFKEAAAPTSQASAMPAIAYTDWWRVFDDAVLDGLEKDADASNQDVAVAVARVDQAAAAARYAGSFLSPTLSLGAGAARTREAQNRPNNGNTGGLAATYNDLQVPLSFSYEIDAWGRVRHSLESARDVHQATVADLRFVRLSIEASVAMDYFSVRESDAEQAIVGSTVESLRQSLELTTNRLRDGIAGELEVEQAKTLLEQSQAQAQALSLQRAQLEHAIAVLVGRPASELSLPASPLAGSPPAIPPGLPADLLARRPDIAAAERYLAASSAQIGVAKTAYLPQFSLSGFAGFESTNPASLLSWQNSIASLLAGVLAPLFNGGRARAGVDQAKAAYRGALAQYEGAVLTAYRDVEDQLAALRLLAAAAQSEAGAVADARRAAEIAMNRYQAGLVGYLEVLVARTTLLSNQRTAAQIDGQRMVAAVALVKALGGGWLGTSAPPRPGPAGRAGELTAAQPPRAGHAHRE